MEWYTPALRMVEWSWHNLTSAITIHSKHYEFLRHGICTHKPMQSLQWPAQPLRAHSGNFRVNSEHPPTAPRGLKPRAATVVPLEQHLATGTVCELSCGSQCTVKVSNVAQYENRIVSGPRPLGTYPLPRPSTDRLSTCFGFGKSWS